MSITRTVGPLSFVVLGAFLVIAGIAVHAVQAPDSFGWIAHEPLGDSLLLLPGQVWGLAMGFVGSLLLSGVLGYRLGQRHLTPSNRKKEDR